MLQWAVLRQMSTMIEQCKYKTSPFFIKNIS